jgi:hypothetical protein
MTMRRSFSIKMLAPGAVLVGALVGLLVLAVVSAHPSGTYSVVLSCGTHTAAISGNTFTQDTTPVAWTPGPTVPTATPPAVFLSCIGPGTDAENVNIPVTWNDWSVAYTCDPGSGGVATTLVIPPTVTLGKWYKLTCPSPGGSHGPAAGDPPDDARLRVTSGSGGEVGGVLEDPDAATLPSEAADDSGGLSAGAYAAIAGAAAAALATATGGFALWRRRIR